MEKLLNFKQHNLSENLKYHLDNEISIVNNIFRLGTYNFYNILKESRILFEKESINLNEDDRIIFETTDIGKFDYFNEELVPLDIPMINILKEKNEYKGKEVSINKPMRSSGPKKYKVYVKDPKTNNVKVVHFGDVKGGLKSKINDPEARKRYDSRHGCSAGKHEDKTKPGYWSCRLPRYAEAIGLTGGGKWW
jgi:hypothetical protein